MKAIVVNELGNSDVLKYEEVSEPELHSDQVFVKNSSIGVNFLDIHFRTIPIKKLPFIPGLEGSGIVTKVGSEVKNFKEGDRVAYFYANDAYAEFTAVSQKYVIKLPDFIDFSQGAALIVQGITAHYLLTSCYQVDKGTKILIHAAAGGVGSLVVQIAKLKGAFVIATTSTKEKVDLVKELGADEVINYKEQDFVKEVKRITNGEGVDVVYDSIGKSTFSGSLDCLKPRGYFVSFGQSSGNVENFNLGLLASKGSLFMTKTSFTNFIATQEEIAMRTNDIFEWVKENKLKSIIDSEFPLEDANKAHQKLESRLSKGKILLKP